MEPEVSLPHPQEPTTGPYPEAHSRLDLPNGVFLSRLFPARYTAPITNSLSVYRLNNFW